MKFRFMLAAVITAGPAVTRLPAQEASVAQLRGDLQRLQSEFAATRQQQQQQIDALTRRLDALTGTPAATSPAPRTEPSQLERELASELSAAPAPRLSAGSPTATDQRLPATNSARPGSSYMNLSYGAVLGAGWSSVADPSAQLQLGDHDPLKRGFALRNAEIAIDGAVDPYFQGFANIVLKLDRNNETEIELEESFLQTTSLPASLQLKAGQYFANFGRQNPQHPHTWAFVDQPLILNRAFGPEGLRSLGAQLSWLAPTPIYTEFFLSILDGQGGTAFGFRNPGEPDAAGVNRLAGRASLDRGLRRAQDLLFVPRMAVSFDLNDSQTLLAGVSGAFGPNDTGPDQRTQIGGLDLFWKWKPANATKGFPFLSWQTEALYQRFEAAADPLAATPLPAETLRDYGFYTQFIYGFVPRWIAGLRADYVNGNTAAFDSSDPFRGKRFRLSPELTFLPSEFSKARLQYNYDHGDLFGTAHSVWMQLEFGLGAHAAHKF